MHALFFFNIFWIINCFFDLKAVRLIYYVKFEY